MRVFLLVGSLLNLLSSRLSYYIYAKYEILMTTPELANILNMYKVDKFITVIKV